MAAFEGKVAIVTGASSGIGKATALILAERGATVVVARNETDGRYVVSAGNLIESGDGQSLVVAIDQLAQLDKAGLKAAYKEQLRRPRDAERASGAGLGLIDIARKSSEPLKASLQTVANGRSFISLSAVI